jgi:DNA-binding IclR family transcriptional regulator
MFVRQAFHAHPFSIAHCAIIIVLWNFSNKRRRALQDKKPAEPRRRGVGSVETAGIILSALVQCGGAARLKQLEEVTGIHSATLHRYLLSLIETGLIWREPDSNRYTFGLLAFRIGGTASRDHDLIGKVAPILSEFSETIGETSAIGMWGGGGAHIAEWFGSNRIISIALNPGVSLSLTKTSTGMMLAACLPRELTEPVIIKECAAGGRSAGRDVEDVYRELKRIGRAGICRVKGTHIPGITSLSVPVFGSDGRMAFVVSVVGSEGGMNSAVKGPVAEALLKLQRRLSRFMGSVERKPKSARPAQ